jgi:ribosomal protein L20A (L18A)
MRSLKMIIVKNPGIKKVMMFMYQQFIKEVSSKVRELEMEYKRLAGKLSAKFDDIKIKI